ncbi:MAG: cation diffusion facilitator family transporter [Candidatus Theseobacter exili]|nr:cation diffusion facilitator family transporter [Candidatus Theseobacter exili]
MAICIFLFKEACHRIIHPQPIKSSLMIFVAGIGLIANTVGTLLLWKASDNNINIRSAFLHLLSDAVSSLAVIIGGIAIFFFNSYWIDPLLTLFISAYVLKECFSILKEASNVLLMGSPKSISLDKIKREIESIEGINNIHHVHMWMLNEQIIHFEAHIDVKDMLISESTQLSLVIEKKLHDLGISHITLQFECNKCSSKNLI